MFKSPFLLVTHVSFWLVYAAFEHVSHLMYGENHWQGSVFASVFIMLATAMLTLLFELVKNKPAFFKYSLLFCSTFLVLIVWHNLTSVLHSHITLTELLKTPLSSWLSGSSYRFLLIVSWAGLYAGSCTYLDKKAQESEMLKARDAMKEAQLQQLMSQLNPHFLFNVLNSIDVSILAKDTHAAHHMVVKLSKLLRSTLEHEFKNKIQLEKELALLNHFIEIEQQRFRQSIHFEYHIQPEALTTYLPPMILQPLMENAIKFSWHLITDCKITLIASINSTQLTIRVSNQFNDKQLIDNQGTKTGLENVRNRLHLLYGDEANLMVEKQNGYFSVELRIPLEIAV